MDYLKESDFLFFLKTDNTSAKIGFLEIKEEKDKYQKGDTEVLLYYSLSSLP